MASWRGDGDRGPQEPSWASTKPPTPPDDKQSIPPYAGRAGAGATMFLPTIGPESPISPVAVRLGNQTLPTVYAAMGSPQSPDDDTLNYSLGDRTFGSQAELEEKRRYALREKEREKAAKERQRAMMQEKREAELARRFEFDQMSNTQEMTKLEREQSERDAIERRRQANILQRAEEERQKEIARRELAQVERKREHSLRMLEMQRLREEEMQRATRDSILAKRKEMERVRDQAERIYHEKKMEESQRKVIIVQEMKDRRDARLMELEKRRLDPVLLQQEREFSQLIEVQASVGRLQTKLEQSMAGREDVRERLLEARHTVEMLEVEERQMTIGVVEVESDLKKLLGYEQALARLVTTRYADDKHEEACIKIQRMYRGVLGRRRGYFLKQAKEQAEMEAAAISIQKVFRGGALRVQKAKELEAEQKKNKGIARLQAMARGRSQRLKAAAIKEAIHRAAMRIQNMARKFLHKKQEEEAMQAAAGQKRASVAGRGRIPPHKVSPPTKKNAGGGSPRKVQQQQQQQQRPAKRKAQPASPPKPLPVAQHRDVQLQQMQLQQYQQQQHYQQQQQYHEQQVMQQQYYEQQMQQGYYQEQQYPHPFPRSVGEGGSPPQHRKIAGNARAKAHINGELGRIYGLSEGGPRSMGPGGGLGSPRSRRFVPVAATAAAAARAEQDGSYAFFPEMPKGAVVEYGAEVPRMSLLELEQQYYQKAEHAPKFRRSY